MSFNVLLKIYHLQNVSIMFLPAVKFISFYSTLPCSAAAVWIKYYFRVSLSNFFFFFRGQKIVHLSCLRTTWRRVKGMKKIRFISRRFLFFFENRVFATACERYHNNINMMIVITSLRTIRRPPTMRTGRIPRVNFSRSSWGVSETILIIIFYIMIFFFNIFILSTATYVYSKRLFFSSYT